MIKFEAVDNLIFTPHYETRFKCTRSYNSHNAIACLLNVLKLHFPQMGFLSNIQSNTTQISVVTEDIIQLFCIFLYLVLVVEIYNKSVYSAVRCWWVYMLQWLNGTKTNQSNVIHSNLMDQSWVVCLFVFYPLHVVFGLFSFLLLFLSVNCCSCNVFIITVHCLFFQFQFSINKIF